MLEPTRRKSRNYLALLKVLMDYQGEKLFNCGYCVRVWQLERGTERARAHLVARRFGKSQ